MKKLILTTINWKDRNPLVFSLFNDQKQPESFWAFDEKGQSLVNRVYIGKVETLAPSIHAAFVKISKDFTCYLPLDGDTIPIYTHKQSRQKDLRPGDEILVQVVKDAVKTKQPVLSTKISIHGAYCVLTNGRAEVGVSKKIPKERAQILKDQVRKLLMDYIQSEVFHGISEPDFGLLLRTNAASVPLDRLLQDVTDTIARYEDMRKRSMHLSFGSLIEGDIPGYIDRMKSLPLDDVTVTTDQEEVYQTIARYFPFLRQNGQLIYYQDPSYSLTALYSFQHLVEQLTKRQIWMKSGANIIIEQLETLTFIDVNSAKNTKGSNLQVNLEAAHEIAKQIRLRNLTGMILIDFINLSDPSENETMIRALKQAIATDPVKCSFVDITGLGLAELTRQKKEKSLREILG